MEIGDLVRVKDVKFPNKPMIEFTGDEVSALRVLQTLHTQTQELAQPYPFAIYCCQLEFFKFPEMRCPPSRQP